MRIANSLLLTVFLLGGLLLGCRPTPLTTLPDVASEPLVQTSPAASTAESTATATVKPQASPTTSLAATVTSSATIEASPLPTQNPTATPIGPCNMRMPKDDLLTAVTLTYGLSPDYAPQDLIPLSDELPMQVTMGYPSEIREVAFGPLVEMIHDMQEEGLQPQILSAYRSYTAQAIAWDKWNELYPERAAIISAPPGYSEHQLGTVVDFGSPELAAIVGQADIEFHTYFYKTSEGIWLAENAHRYGFTLSFPVEAREVTGFYFEPWHFRYVGTEMATLLYGMDSSLSVFQLTTQTEPCIP